MSTMPLYLYSPETEWALACASSEAAHAPSGSRARQIAVNVLGWTCITGCVATAAWMLVSTPARAAIADWSTMGKVAAAHVEANEVEAVQPGAVAAYATPPAGLAAASFAAVADAGAPRGQDASASASVRAAADAGAPDAQIVRTAASPKAMADAGAPVVARAARAHALAHRAAPPVKAHPVDDPYTEEELQKVLSEDPYAASPAPSEPYMPTDL